MPSRFKLQCLRDSDSKPTVEFNFARRRETDTLTRQVALARDARRMLDKFEIQTLNLLLNSTLLVDARLIRV